MSAWGLRQGGGSSCGSGPPESPPPTEAQEDEITENLVNIQKMQKTQVKCRKVSREGETLCELGTWESLLASTVIPEPEGLGSHLSSVA